MKQIWTGGGGGGEEGVYNCYIAQAATQLPYVLLCSCQLSIRNVLLYPFLFSKIRSCDACQRVNRKMVISTPQLHPIPVKAGIILGLISSAQ